MKFVLKIIVPAISMLLLAATSAVGASPLAGSEWGLAGQDTPFVRFEAEGRVAGHGGCNRFFGGYEISGESLKIGPLRATRMACAGPVMEEEAAFLARLQEAAGFRREDGRLELLDGEGGVLMVLHHRDWD